jgi:drug/metabolite transporter (DMT)-like permease
MSRRKPPSASQIRLAFLITSLGGLLFTLDLPLLRLSFADQWTMVFARGLFLFVAISASWQVMRLRNRDRHPFIAGFPGAMVAAASTIGNMSYIGAATHTNAANVVFIIALTPIIAAAMSRLVLGEKVHAWTWTATLLAFFGVGIIAWDGIAVGNFNGDLMALMSAYCSALIFTIIRASGAKVATSLSIGSLASAIIAITMFSVSPYSLLNAGFAGIPAWVWLALNGLVAIPLATVLLANGPRVLPSADVSMFFMLETIAGAQRVAVQYQPPAKSRLTAPKTLRSCAKGKYLLTLRRR